MFECLDEPYPETQLLHLVSAVGQNEGVESPTKLLKLQLSWDGRKSRLPAAIINCSNVSIALISSLFWSFSEVEK